MGKVTGLSESDRRRISDLSHKVDNASNSTRRPVTVDNPEHFDVSPEVYLAKTPAAGIAGISTDLGTGVGTGDNTYTAHYGECRIWRKLNDDTLEVLGEISRRVYNASEQAVAGDTWVLLKRDKPGTWWVDGLGGDSDPDAIVCLDNLTHEQTAAFDAAVVDATWVDIPGTEATLTLSQAMDCVVLATFDFDGTGTAVAGSRYDGALVVDGVRRAKVAPKDLDSALSRGGTTQHWLLSSLVAGTHLVKLQARKGAGGGSAYVRAANTGWVIHSETLECADGEEAGTGTGTGTILGTGTDVGTGTAGGCAPITLTEEQVRCESGALNVYLRTITLDTVGGCLTKVTGDWAYARKEGSCGVSTINITNINNYLNYVEGDIYFNQYDNRIYINVDGLWYAWCICYEDTGTGILTTGTGTGTGVGGGLVATACCPVNLLPDILHVTFAGALSALATQRLVYDAGLDSWLGTAAACGGPTIRLQCLAGTWSLTLVTGTSFTASGTGLSCSPAFSVSFSATAFGVCNGAASATATT